MARRGGTRVARSYFSPSQDLLTGTSRVDYFTAAVFSDLNPALPGSLEGAEGSIVSDPILGSAYKLKASTFDKIQGYTPGDIIDLPGNYGSSYVRRGRTYASPALVSVPTESIVSRIGDPSADQIAEYNAVNQKISNVLATLGSGQVGAFQVSWPIGGGNFVYLLGRDESQRPWGLTISNYGVSQQAPLSFV